MNTYTIIATRHIVCSITKVIEKDRVKQECERLRKVFSSKLNDNHYTRIEVVNNDTGEIREYWNNKQNETLF